MPCVSVSVCVRPGTPQEPHELDDSIHLHWEEVFHDEISDTGVSAFSGLMNKVLDIFAQLRHSLVEESLQVVEQIIIEVLLLPQGSSSLSVRRSPRATIVPLPIFPDLLFVFPLYQLQLSLGVLFKGGVFYAG